MKTYVIGRSQYADIVLADASVAPRHGELVVTEDGRYHVTDCATASGIWRRGKGDDGGARWERVRQTFVAEDETLRFGDYGCNVRELLRLVEPAEAGDGGGRWRPEMVRDAGPDLPHGRVERDPLTGEIIRRRL